MPHKSASNYSVNSNGGIYRPGCTYPIEKKFDVAINYLELLKKGNGAKPTVDSVAKSSRVGWDFAKKVMMEVQDYNCVLPPPVPNESELRQRGVGSKSLTPEEEVFLLWLRFEDPHRSNQSYVNSLYASFGKQVSTTFISEWFKCRFDHKGNFKVPSLEPLDKYKPENIAAYLEFLQFRSSVDPSRFKFIDEKGLKGTDLFYRKARQDPVTGIMDAMPVDGDFRNTYNLIAAIASDFQKSPIVAIAGPDNGKSANFIAFIIHLLEKQWFNKYDILVLDNWIGHVAGESDILQDLLWNAPGPDGQPLRILVKTLPTRSPELNPIELIFQTMVQRLKAVSLEDRPHHDAILYYLDLVLKSISHELVLKTMIHDGC